MPSKSFGDQHSGLHHFEWEWEEGKNAWPSIHAEYLPKNVAKQAKIAHWSIRILQCLNQIIWLECECKMVHISFAASMSNQWLHNFLKPFTFVGEISSSRKSARRWLNSPQINKSAHYKIYTHARIFSRFNAQLLQKFVYLCDTHTNTNTPIFHWLQCYRNDDISKKINANCNNNKGKKTPKYTQTK